MDDQGRGQRIVLHQLQQLLPSDGDRQGPLTSPLPPARQTNAFRRRRKYLTPEEIDEPLRPRAKLEGTGRAIARSCNSLTLDQQSRVHSIDDVISPMACRLQQHHSRARERSPLRPGRAQRLHDGHQIVELEERVRLAEGWRVDTSAAREWLFRRYHAGAHPAARRG